MEEIDIIELLKRVKEGKAPKEIEIGSIFYRLVPSYASFSMEYWYEDDKENRWKIEEYSLYTKIKILDKPKIEEIHLHPDEVQNSTERKLEIKINEIIDYINNKE